MIKHLYIINGISGSGKTKYAIDHCFELNASYSSPDNPEVVLNPSGFNTIIEDSTGESIWRRAMVKRCQKNYDKIICVYMKTPVEIATARIRERNQKIHDGINNPFEVLTDEEAAIRQDKDFQEPNISEGYDEIIVIENK